MWHMGGVTIYYAQAIVWSQPYAFVFVLCCRYIADWFPVACILNIMENKVVNNLDLTLQADFDITLALQNIYTIMYCI